MADRKLKIRTKGAHRINSWLASARKAGYTDTHIRKILGGAGWQGKQIDAVLPDNQAPRLDFIFLGMVFVAIVVTFALYVSASPDLQEFLASGLITGFSASDAPAKEFKLSASQPKVKIDFEPRTDNKDLPANWFISESSNMDGVDKKEWTWVPLDNKKQGALIVDLGEMLLPSSWDRMPKAMIFSKPITNIGTSKYNISMVYIPEFSGECMQIGMDVLFDNLMSDTTYIMNLNEVGESTATNFDITAQTLNGKTILSAVTQEIIPHNKIIFYIHSLCGSGRVTFEDFTISKVI